jgi:chemotaxis signal transduction protein
MSESALTTPIADTLLDPDRRLGQRFVRRTSARRPLPQLRSVRRQRAAAARPARSRGLRRIVDVDPGGGEGRGRSGNRALPRVSRGAGVARVFRDQSPRDHRAKRGPERAAPASEVLLGLVNVRGELHPCVSLHTLFGEEMAAHRSRTARFLVARWAGEDWVFPVDQVDGMHDVAVKDIEPLPVTLTNVAVVYTQGLFHSRRKTVAIIDESLLFGAVAEKIA